jgi:hypothetical protein
VRLTVTEVNVPAWSTVGFAVGVDEQGVEWSFVVDHRPGRVLVEALEAGEEILVDVEDYQLLGGPMDGHV